AGKRVVRFKGGDNFVFGRGYEEIIACREAGVPVTVIPGISSPIAVPGIAGIPVTHRGITHEFTIISGHLPPGHPESLVAWDGVARMRGTVVVMMGVENAPAIAATLVELGRDPETPVAVVCDGTMPTQRTVLSRLGRLADDMAAHEVKAPAIIVIGEVVRVAHPEV
ncbi:MAG: uroporphyrinogen-III C-methyltransferase, partial [Microbacterium sp.]